MKKFWPFNRKQKQIVNTYGSEVSLAKAVELIANEMGFVGVESLSGKVVTDQTAMNFSAVYACVSLLAGTIASLPFEVFKDLGDDESEIAKTHPVYKLINSAPNSTMSAYVFWENDMAEMFLNGNGFAAIKRVLTGPKFGEPESIYWLPQKTVTPFFSPDHKRIWYRISLYNETIVLDQDDMLHFPCIGWDGLKGSSPITHARESIGLGLAGESFNANYFTNAISSNVHIGYPKSLSEPAEKRLKAYLMDRMNGGPAARAPLVTTDDAKVSNLQMNADDAQMMLSRVFQIEDICRFYGVPLHLVSSTDKSTSWGTGIEQQTIGFVMFTLRKRLKMIEQEVNRKLISDNKYFCKFNLDGLLRGDAAARGNYYSVMRGGNQLPGIMSVNEIRKTEGLRPLPDKKFNIPYEPIPGYAGNEGKNADNQPTKPAKTDEKQTDSADNGEENG